MAATKRIGNEWAVKTRSGDRKESGGPAERGQDSAPSAFF
jgi:hypothetical protein